MKRALLREREPLPRSFGGEELWVIARAPESNAMDDDTVTRPDLRAKLKDRSEEIPLPLAHTDVTARIAGYIAEVRVKQQYQNPYSSKIEAVYVFPLPHDAAVSEFVMTIGKRRIRGIIRERKEAEELYEEAKRGGYVASLLTQERPNVFTQSLANIEPGKAIEIDRIAADRIRVALSRHDRVPNKDFVLRYRLAGDALKTAFLSHRDERGGYFTLMLQPPASLAAEDRAPMEMIFVLGCSGSMDGTPIAIAKGATERALRTLGPDDTFQIIQFSTTATQLGLDPLPATPENVRRGIEYVRGLDGEGGTEMINGIRAALDFPHDPRRLRIVSFMTDGYIGNETEILDAIHHRLGSARIFSFGIGSSTNRYLLEGMARAGRGAVAFVGVDEGFAGAIDDFYARVSHPALTAIDIDWGDLQVGDVFPQPIPDLFVGRPVVLTGRLRNDPGSAEIVVRGRAGTRSETVRVRASSRGDNEAIARLWARAKITDLEEDEERTPQTAREIRDLALAYDLMSPYTAFVAVDSSARTKGRRGTTVAQPDPVPKGVDYESAQ